MIQLIYFYLVYSINNLGNMTFKSIEEKTQIIRLRLGIPKEILLTKVKSYNCQFQSTHHMNSCPKNTGIGIRLKTSPISSDSRTTTVL